MSFSVNKETGLSRMGADGLNPKKNSNITREAESNTSNEAEGESELYTAPKTAYTEHYIIIFLKINID